ncbi:MAG: hypothetical protein GX804_10385 [Lentisphaerae bacterium]|jgi:hypothetical protein|nr:hypothetical protein [Lentisphaerota bacterium]
MIEILIMTIVIAAIASINKGKQKNTEQDLPETDYVPERRTSSVYEILEELNRSRQPVPADDGRAHGPVIVPSRSPYKMVEVGIDRDNKKRSPSPPPLQRKFTEVSQPKTTYTSSKSSQKSTAGKSNALSHPIFKIENLTSKEITQRAIVIREIFGPPVSLRHF